MFSRYVSCLYAFFPFCVAGALGLLDFQIEVYPMSTFSFQWHTARSERNLYCSSPKQILLS